jgi:hypothetical protein
MRGHIMVAALAGMLAIVLMDAAPTLHRQYSLALATGHELPWPTAHGALKQENYKYDRGPLHPQIYQRDPWGHWGSYYGPMIH